MTQKYQPRALTARHREALRRLALGQRQKDVAAAMGVTPRMVAYVQHSDEGEKYLARIADGRDESAMDIARALQDLAPAAVETLYEGVTGQLGTSAPDHMKLKSAESILDRAGYGRTTKQDVRVIKHVGIEHIRRLAMQTATNPNVTALEFLVDSERAKSTGNGDEMQPQADETDTNQSEANG